MSTTGIRVVLLPDSHWSGRDLVREHLERTTLILSIDTPPESHLVCATLISAPLAAPLVIVAHGASCQLLPSVALSLRTQHLDTCAYVLVDPDAPPSTDVWPESPVVVISTDPKAPETSLRGWPVTKAAVCEVASLATDHVSEFLATNPQRS